MKTLCTIILVAALSLPALATSGGNDYLITQRGKVVVSDLSFGLFNIRVRHDDGQSFKIRYSDVVSYKRGDRIYEKKDLFTNDVKTGTKVFMELICQENGLRLYRYMDNDNYFFREKSTITGTENTCKYFVYKRDQYLLQLNQKNHEMVFGFFLN